MAQILASEGPRGTSGPGGNPGFAAISLRGLEQLDFFSFTKPSFSTCWLPNLEERGEAGTRCGSALKGLKPNWGNESRYEKRPALSQHLSAGAQGGENVRVRDLRPVLLLLLLCDLRPVIEPLCLSLSSSVRQIIAKGSLSPILEIDKLRPSMGKTLPRVTG